MVQARAGGHVRAAEVDAAAPLVGGADRHQARGQPDDVLYIPVRAWLVLNRPHAKRGQVVLEVILLDGGEGIVGRAGPRSRRVEYVIDVGDVAADLRFDSQQAQHPAQRVDPDERGGMPEVGDVVRGDPAGVNPGVVQHRHPAPGEDELGAARLQVIGHVHSVRPDCGHRAETQWAVSAGAAYGIRRLAWLCSYACSIRVTFWTG